MSTKKFLVKKLVPAVLLVMALGVVTLPGCGPRAGVIKDKVVAQFDKLLGELDVKKKKIELEAAKLESDLDDIRQKRIETEVRLENLKSKKANAEADLKKILDRMSQMSELIKSAGDSGSVEKNGKTYTAEQLKATADELIADHARAKKELETNLTTSLNAMNRAYDFLKKQEAAGLKFKEDIRARMSEIENKKAAIDTAKSSALLAGTETSITEKYKDLSKQIEDLSVDIETQFRTEEENLKDLDRDTKLADELLGESGDLKSTLSQMDAILGAANGSAGDKQ